MGNTGIFNLSYIEHAYGVYHVKGGLNRLTAAMAKVAKEEGARIRTNSGVKQLLLDKKTVKGIELENGEKIMADEVVINVHAMTKLVPSGVLKKYSEEKLSKKPFMLDVYVVLRANSILQTYDQELYAIKPLPEHGGQVTFQF